MGSLQTVSSNANASMAEGSEKLWECARALLDDAVAQGFLAAKK
jgi:hypothetical protein